MADKSSETTATGTIAISLEVPSIAYKNGGTTLVSDVKQKWMEFSAPKLNYNSGRSIE